MAQKDEGGYPSGARKRVRRANKARIVSSHPKLEGKSLTKRVGAQTKAAIARHKERGVVGPQGKTAAEYKADKPKGKAPKPDKVNPKPNKGGKKPTGKPPVAKKDKKPASRPPARAAAPAARRAPSGGSRAAAPAGRAKPKPKPKSKNTGRLGLHDMSAKPKKATPKQKVDPRSRGKKTMTPEAAAIAARTRKAPPKSDVGEHGGLGQTPPKKTPPKMRPQRTLKPPSNHASPKPKPVLRPSDYYVPGLSKEDQDRARRR